MTQETIASITADLLFDMEIDAKETELHLLALRQLYVEKLLDGLSQEPGLIVSTQRPSVRRPGKATPKTVRHIVHHEGTGKVLLEIYLGENPGNGEDRRFRIKVLNNEVLLK